MTQPIEFQKNSICLSISREMALDHGLVEPTPEEKAERERRAAEFRAKVREAWHVYANATQALDNLTDPGARAALDLHAPDADGYIVSCRHCYTDTEMGDKTEWPCETAEVIARAYGIDLPSAMLYRDYR